MLYLRDLLGYGPCARLAMPQASKIQLITSSGWQSVTIIQTEAQL